VEDERRLVVEEEGGRGARGGGGWKTYRSTCHSTPFWLAVTRVSTILRMLRQNVMIHNVNVKKCVYYLKGLTHEMVWLLMTCMVKA
jgi:hypothetical protein